MPPGITPCRSGRSRRQSRYQLARSGTAGPLTAKLPPISIDGLLVAGTLAVLDASRRQTGHAGAARITVGLGVAMTMWANIVHGLAFGWTGIILSGWPPVALMAAIEVLARMIRPSPVAEALHPAAPEPPAALNGHAAEAVELFGTGSVPSVRRIRREMHIGQPRAQQVQSYLSELAGSNGHGEVKTT